ncbi:ABC transporter substrate-binding protein [Bacillus sp. V33-4]|uniref:ABC transporter substrate-binding protein n=1 Tax=Bacillus sp. V33-4 TaxID=2054169 RepID=UPI000C761E1E|nr:ABC transporter substrate-binding protein [Bacillus sp. V33-4]PLR87129.1 LacI family transcriptional regulator [Bacillus sp. V33-4]
MRKILLALILCFLVALTLTACGGASPVQKSNSSAEKGKDGPLAIVVPSADHGWMAGIAYFAEQKSKELGLEDGTGYKIVTSKNANEQANQIDEMINLGSSAVVLLPHSDEVSVAAQKIVDAKIPLVVFDRKVAADYSAYVAGDNDGIGSDSADYLGKKLNGEGSIAVLNVPSSGSVSTERVEAFKAVMKEKYPNISLKDITASDFTQQSGLKAATDALVANNHLDAIFSIDDESSLGILQAISDAKRTDIKYVSGAGGSQSYFNKIAKSTVPELFTATYSPNMIKDAIQAAVDLVEGKTVEKDTIIPPTIVTSENVSDLLDENSPY